MPSYGSSSYIPHRLYLILTVMASVMFAINIAQVVKLRERHSYLWINLFPGMVFAAFLVALIGWAWFAWRGQRTRGQRVQSPGLAQSRTKACQYPEDLLYEQGLPFIQGISCPHVSSLCPR